MGRAVLLQLVVVVSAVATAAAACGDGPSVDRSAAPIIGGIPDHIHEAVVGLNLDQEALCTGTVVAPRVILTAAHCVQPLVDSGRDAFIIATFGESVFDPLVEVWSVRAVYHKRYADQVVGFFDVAMILLEQDAPVTPIPLNEA